MPSEYEYIRVICALLLLVAMVVPILDLLFDPARWWRVWTRPHRRVYLKFLGKPWSLDLIWRGRYAEEAARAYRRMKLFRDARKASDLEWAAMYGDTSAPPPMTYLGIVRGGRTTMATGTGRAAVSDWEARSGIKIGRHWDGGDITPGRMVYSYVMEPDGRYVVDTTPLGRSPT